MNLCPSIIQRTRFGETPQVPDDAERLSEWTLKYTRIPLEDRLGLTAVHTVKRSDMTDPRELIR